MGINVSLLTYELKSNVLIVYITDLPMGLIMFYLFTLDNLFSLKLIRQINNLLVDEVIEGMFTVL